MQCKTNIVVFPHRLLTSTVQGFGGSFKGFLDEFQRRHNGDGTALDLVEMVIETFPSFRDEHYLEERKGPSFNSQGHAIH